MTDITVKTNNTDIDFPLCEHITIAANKSDGYYEYIECLWLRCEVCSQEHNIDIEVG